MTNVLKNKPLTKDMVSGAIIRILYEHAEGMSFTLLLNTVRAKIHKKTSKVTFSSRLKHLEVNQIVVKGRLRNDPWRLHPKIREVIEVVGDFRIKPKIRLHALKCIIKFSLNYNTWTKLKKVGLNLGGRHVPLQELRKKNTDYLDKIVSIPLGTKQVQLMANITGNLVKTPFVNVIIDIQGRVYTNTYNEAVDLFHRESRGFAKVLAIKMGLSESTFWEKAFVEFPGPVHLALADPIFSNFVGQSAKVIGTKWWVDTSLGVPELECELKMNAASETIMIIDVAKSVYEYLSENAIQFNLQTFLDFCYCVIEKGIKEVWKRINPRPHHPVDVI